MIYCLMYHIHMIIFFHISKVNVRSLHKAIQLTVKDCWFSSNSISCTNFSRVIDIFVFKNHSKSEWSTVSQIDHDHISTPRNIHVPSFAHENQSNRTHRNCEKFQKKIPRQTLRNCPQDSSTLYAFHAHDISHIIWVGLIGCDRKHSLSDSRSKRSWHTNDTRLSTKRSRRSLGSSTRRERRSDPEDLAGRGDGALGISGLVFDLGRCFMSEIWRPVS